MRIARATAVGILLASVLALGGCKKKKPAVPPPQAQAPTITQPQAEPPAPPPPVAAEPNRPAPEAEQPESATAPQPTPAPKPKKPRHPASAKKTPPPAVEKPAEKQPPRTVVEDGSTQPATPQLSASLPPETAIHQKFNTAQLLQSTDSNLKSITRTLTKDEQAMVQTIHSFMNQSREASKDGDIDLAYRLALKAHLLSGELVKR